MQYRLATLADLPVLIEMAKTTLPGFVQQIWAERAEPGQNLDKIAEITQSGFVIRKATVLAEMDGHVAGMLITYPMADDAGDIHADTPPSLHPVLRLYRLAKNSWYLHGIATRPNFRGRGIASRFLSMAEDQAKAAGFAQISLVVLATNLSAIALYRARGYALVASDTTAENPPHYAIDLMIKRLGA